MNNRTRLCLQPWNTINVGADGLVYPCCVTVDDMVIGNLAESSLEEIILGAKMAEIRDRLVTGNLAGACTGCQNAGPTTVKAFQRALNMHLSASASELQMRHRLVMRPVDGLELHAVGTLKTTYRNSEIDDERIESYAGFSPTSYLEGHLNLAKDFTLGLWANWARTSESGMILHYAQYNGPICVGPVLEMTVGSNGCPQVVMSPDGYNHVYVLGAEAREDQKWFHLTLTRQSDFTSLYIDGVPVSARPTFAGEIENADAIARVGVNAAAGRGSAFSGSIAGLFVESDCMTSQEILDMYEAEASMFI